MTLDSVEQRPAAGAEAGGGDRLYACFDFRIRSDMELPELSAAAGGNVRPVVTVRLGRQRPSAEDRGALERAADGAARLTVPAVGVFTVTGGTEIHVEPAPGVSARNLRLFLLGSALGILCHQRGLTPLHANGVVVGGRVHAFAGASGAGKSTLAAHFAREGLRVLSDDVVAVGQAETGRPSTWPGVARLKLWGDASAALGHDVSGLDRALDGVDKYHVPLATPAEAGPLPFARLYLLERAAPGEERGIVRLRGGEALAAVIGHTYRGAYLPELGLVEAHFRRCVALTAAIEVYVATRAWGFDCFEREAARLLAHCAQDGGDR